MKNLPDSESAALKWNGAKVRFCYYCEHDKLECDFDQESAYCKDCRNLRHREMYQAKKEGPAAVAALKSERAMRSKEAWGRDRHKQVLDCVEGRGWQIEEVVVLGGVYMISCGKPGHKAVRFNPARLEATKRCRDCYHEERQNSAVSHAEHLLKNWRYCDIDVWAESNGVKNILYYSAVCPENHPHKSRVFRHLESRAGLCSVCDGTRRTPEIALADMRAAAVKEGGVCLGTASDYKTQNSPVRFQCGRGHEPFTSSYVAVVKDKNFCPHRDCIFAKTQRQMRRVREYLHWDATQADRTIYAAGAYEWAVVEWLNLNRIRYNWQITKTIPEELGIGREYRLDLYLIDEDTSVEIKGLWRNPQAHDREKWAWYQTTGESAHYEVWMLGELKAKGIYSKKRALRGSRGHVNAFEKDPETGWTPEEAGLIRYAPAELEDFDDAEDSDDMKMDELDEIEDLVSVMAKSR